MNSLADLQQRFVHALVEPQAVPAPAAIEADGLSSARRLQVYRNNLHANLGDALVSVFPAVRRLVGEEYFAAVCHDYIERHRSTQGDLHAFGRAFPDFLRRLPALEGVPYVVDVAHLEWACDEVYHAAESDPLDVRALSRVEPEEYGNLRFRIHPAVRLLASDYPVFRIWQTNQAGWTGDQTVRLDEGADQLLIRRDGMEVFVERLTAGEFLLLDALASGVTLAAAYERVLAAGETLSLDARLSARIADSTLVGFRRTGQRRRHQ